MGIAHTSQCGLTGSPGMQLHELTRLIIQEPEDNCSFCGYFQGLGKMTTLTRQDLNFGQGNVLY